MYVVTAAQMRAAEKWAGQHGASTTVLMDRAGDSIAREVIATSPGIRRRLVVLAGPGNNGGDGLVAAERLARWGWDVTAAHLPRNADPDAPMLALQTSPAQIIPLSTDQALTELRERIFSADVIVDSLFGTGSSRALSGIAAAVLSLLGNRRPDSVLVAVDVPSGLNADTGAVDHATPEADVTVTFGAPKLGLYREPGASFAGRIVVDDIGLPAAAFADVQREVLSPAIARTLIPPRPANGHKGTFGKLMVVAGSRNFVGAAALCASAAQRVGAGLITVAAAEGVYRQLAGRLLESTYLPLAETPTGQIAESAADTLIPALEGYDAVVLGPGLGRSQSTDAFIRRLLSALQAPIIIDADGLNSLAEEVDWWRRLSVNTVLTPHSGEMARLLGVTISDVEADRLAVAEAAAAEWGVTVLLKGPITLIASPDGRLRLHPGANPAMASAGTGDVLSGTIGGLQAQGQTAFDAASLGAYLHAKAGALWSDVHGNAGLLASDLLTMLPLARMATETE